MVDTTGFVTSLVINVAIALVATTAFILLRPRFPWCYDTRRNAKRRVIGTEPPTVPPGLFAWLPKVLQLTDAQVLSTSGLDGLMLIKFFEMCATLFIALCVIGLGILLPVNFTAHGDIADAFDKMSMANVVTGSRRFWAHLIIAYLFCGMFYYLAWHTWKSYMNLRHQHMARWTLLGGNHTIMIHELPAELRTDQALFAHFQQLYPGQVRSARMAKDLSMKTTRKAGGDIDIDNLPDNVLARDQMVAALEHDVAAWRKQQADSKLTPEKRNARPQTATKMLCCGKVDAIDHHYAELERLNRVVKEKQAQFDPAGQAARSNQLPTLLSGFVTFHSSRTAVAAANAYVYDTTPFSFNVKAAPELRDVYWPSLNLSHAQRSMRTLLFNGITAALILFYMVPMGFLMGLANLQGLAEKYSWLDGINSIPDVILGFIQAYLPAILLSVFFAILPLILLVFSKMQGIEAHSWLAKSVINKYFLFMVVNFFFGAIVGGAVFGNIQELVSDINNVPRVLGEQIPTVSNYFTTYVALAAFAGFPLQMAQLPRLIIGGLKKKYLALTPREFEQCEAPPQLDYGVSYCPHLFIFLVSMTYSFISPIIIPFAAVYYVLGYVVYKYQLVHVYVQRFESGGVFWPTVYSKMSSSLFIAQVCLVGIFGLKEVPAQAVLVVPLPFLTLIFDRLVHNAIKSKLKSLPLSQMLEIDTLRKAERMEREKDAAAGGEQAKGEAGRDPKEKGMRWEKDSNAFESRNGQVDMSVADGHVQRSSVSAAGAGAGGQSSGGAPAQSDVDLAAAKEHRIATDPVSARASDLPKTSLQYETRNEDATAATPSVKLHTQARIVEQKDQNGTTGNTRSYVADEERNQSSLRNNMPPVATQAVGFPYLDDEQERAFVEGDVPAYVQPELTDATPAEVVVDGAAELLSDNSGSAGTGHIGAKGGNYGATATTSHQQRAQDLALDEQRKADSMA